MPDIGRLPPVVPGSEMSFIPRLCLAVVCTVMFGGVASAQPYFARAQVITAPEADNDFVNSVDVDGEWAAAGGVQRFVSPGQAGVFIYRRISGTWTAFQRLSCPIAGGYMCNDYGRSVALSGTTLAVSAGGSNLYTGVIWIYGFNGTTWTLQTTLNPPAGKHLGDWMALDGNYLVSAGAVNNSSAGWDAYVFERSGSEWTRYTLAGTDRVPQDAFGLGVGISGNLVCVGAPGSIAGSIPGSVHVFRRTGAGWVQEGPKLTPQATPRAMAGQTCAIDGDTMVMGTPMLFTQGQPGSGRAYVYRHVGGTWTLQQNIVAGAGVEGLTSALAIKDNGLVIGANQSESALFFARVGNDWVERGRDQNPIPNAALGDSVATDGATLMVGGTRSNFTPGVLTVYVPSNTPPTPPTGPPGAPTGLQATVNGNQVQFSWVPPASGGAPTGYTLVARTTGGTLLTTLAVGAGTSYAVTAPNGVYSVTVRGTNAHGAGVESAAVVVTVPTLPPVPGAPTSLAATVTGNSASFTWGAPVTGGTPSGYTLLAGVTPGFTNPVAVMSLPASPRSTGVGNIPPGTYYVRLVAQNAGGVSPPSSEITVTVAAPTPPGAPVLNPATVTGHTVGLSWAPGSGSAPTSYVLTATSPGGAVLATVMLTAPAASFPNIPSGTYLVRIVGVNAVGPGAASNTITVVVP